MQRVFLWCCYFGAWVLQGGFDLNAQTNVSTSQVIRLTVRESGKTWMISTNGANAVRLNAVDVLKRLSLSGLGHDDVIVFQRPTKFTEPDSREVQRIAQFCESNRVAIFIYEPEKGSGDIMSIPICHWEVEKRPYVFDSAVFFLEGKNFGKGESGFQLMLNDLEKRRCGIVFVVGSRFSEGSSLTYGHFLSTKEHSRIRAVLRDPRKVLLPSEIDALD